MSTSDAAPAVSRGKGLPTYVVLDVSKSMEAHEALLNKTLEEILETLYSNPRISEFIHLSIITFSTRPHVVLGMTGISDLTGVPTVQCRGTTNFAPLFELLRERIDVDLQRLLATRITPLRPVVFLLTDGAPADRPYERWTEALSGLTDPSWKPHPHLITYGFGEAVESVLKQMSTVAAFIADPRQGTNSEALSSALASLLNSLVASVQAQRLLVPEEVKGYRSLPLDPIEY
ncbi:hypothetical protein [Actinocorallia longicatena]|uniref:VWA domain-containing protein n=1 Tax=Actinocorallia longicatena TaxID=111803 RepID=A0ABP6QI69_9ACTN